MELFNEEQKENLVQELDLFWRKGFIDDYKTLPTYITENLNPAFEIRPYQMEALARLRFYWERLRKKDSPTQLLFEMATGSGKTLIMAACILELYQLGYRHFIFFVNTDTIIQKTKENFLNAISRKYLFAKRLAFGGKRVNIIEEETLETPSQDVDIHIHFTTIQGLHSKLAQPRENSLTYEDFKEQKVVLLSDEAHHLNAETKKVGKTKVENNDTVSWETTVNDIFKSHPENVMLEFTATAELGNREINAKYIDKLLFKYDLFKFRNDGYSKEVKTLQADMETMDRVLQAVILSQYRKKVYNQYAQDIEGTIKPVILMKSKTIADSKTFEQKFYEKIKTITAEDIQRLRKNASDTVMQNAFSYFEAQGVAWEALALELRMDFAPEFCLSVNSKEEASDKQLAVNDLENPKNLYRVIFAVDKLNEGWDVLNLFDIVRLYETRDSHGNKPGKSTVAEAQLIGRGARYYPFQILPTQEKYKRKYDQDLDNPLRILEEIHYHSRYDSRYIGELNIALRNLGLMDEKPPIPRENKRNIHTINRLIQKEIDIDSLVIFVNKRISLDEVGLYQQSYSEPYIKPNYSRTIATGQVYEKYALDSKLTLDLKTDTQTWYFPTSKKRKSELIFGIQVVRKAMQRLPFYYFNNLQNHYPHLQKWEDFLEKLQDVEVKVTGATDTVKALLPAQQLAIVEYVLAEIAQFIQNTYGEYRGTKSFYPIPLKNIIQDKTLFFSKIHGETGLPLSESIGKKFYFDIKNSDWYVFDDCFGTDQEKYFLQFIHEQVQTLRTQYKEFLLVRNERTFKLYNFSDGRAFEPDFVLILITEKGQKHLYIEPKGDFLDQKDAWKEAFLLALEGESKIAVEYENRYFKLIGLPFFNTANPQNSKFRKVFEQETM
jgi:type III restriction enzyme